MDSKNESRNDYHKTAREFPYQLLPSLDDAEYQALKEDIARRGVLVAVEMDECERVLDGHHRLQICAELVLCQVSL